MAKEGTDVANSLKRKNKEELRPQKHKKVVTRGNPTGDRKDVVQTNAVIAQMNGALLADFIAQQTRRFEQDLSLVELEDRRVPQTAFTDTSGWTGVRSLDNLPLFLEHFTGATREQLAEPPSPSSSGAPRILVVTCAGLRAADITRALRVYQTTSTPIAKLFAKHIKLQDAIKFVKNTRMSIGVGTPQRLLDLLDQNALSVDDMTHLVLDGSHIDVKSRGLFDMRETIAPMTKLLSRHQLKRRYGGDRQKEVKILVF